ncbi:MAG: alcohol dehydrogenase catalytic domain-containing protein [Planctomycetota bacterium]|nr:alcohol dehydrogenase catalytic domain-containing protein [Planctomycetota bacterium]
MSRLNGLSLSETDPPVLPGADWVLCRTVLGGICGSDLAIIAQRQPPNSLLQSFSTLPAVMGHENVAVVEQVGGGVDSGWLGKRICVEPTLCCRVRGIGPPCEPCRAGQFGACENFAADGQGSARLPPGTSLGYCGPVGGSWSEYFVAHVSQLVEVPQQLSNAYAVLTDPLACSLHAVLRANLSGAERVLVYGAGILGLGIVWALRAVGFGGNIDVVARHRHQGRLAEALSADEVLYLTAGKRERFQAVVERTGARLTRARFGNYMLSGGYDVVFECVGSDDSIEEALKWTAARGRVILVGTGHGRGADMTALWFRELTVIGAYGRGVEDFAGRRIQTYQLVHELMLTGGLDLSVLLTHTFPLADYKKALSVAMHKARNESIKVAFRF